jgi:ArsR family transcriptional regulator
MTTGPFAVILNAAIQTRSTLAALMPINDSSKFLNSAGQTGVNPKRAMFRHVAETAHAFASPVRVEIIDLLVQCPRHVEALADLTQHSVANVSQHLQALKRAGLVSAKRQGNHVIHELAGDAVLMAYAHLGFAADRVSHGAQATRSAHYLTRDPEPAVPVAELGPWVRAERAAILDVRPSEEFAFARVPGAISHPIGHIRAGLAPSGLGNSVLAYCRGPHCTYAYEAIVLLREQGFKARRLEGGFLAWRLAQLRQ